MVDSADERPTTRWERFVEVLTGGWTLKWPTFGIFAAIGIPFAFVSEYPRLITPNFLTAFTISCISIAVTILLLFVLRLLSRLSPRVLAPFVLLGLSGVGATRGWVTTTIVNQLELNVQSFLGSRVILSTLAVPLLTVVSAFIASTIAQNIRDRAAFENDITELQRERDGVLLDISHANNVVLTESEHTLRPRIDRISSTLASVPPVSRSAIADMLDDLITTVVRPLSHSLAARAREHHAISEPMAETADAPAFPTADSFIGPLLSAIAVFMTTVVIAFDIVPLTDGMLVGVTGAAIAWLTLFVAHSFLRERRFSVRTVVAVVVTGHAAIGLLVSWFTVTVFSRYGFGNEVAVAFLTANLLTGLLFLVHRLVAHQSSLRLFDLAQTRREMSLQVSEVRRRAWLHQRHIAHALHSAIQSRVYAKSRLVRAAEGPIDSDEIERITTTLDGIVDVLRGKDGGPSDSLIELERAIEFWAGMCSIELTVDERVSELVDADSEIGEAVLVICLEMINNAIRHGKATVISVAIELASFDVIRITERNNGSPVATTVPGLGMASFDELTVHWSLDSDDSATTVVAYIAARRTAGRPDHT